MRLIVLSIVLLFSLTTYASGSTGGGSGGGGGGGAASSATGGSLNETVEKARESLLIRMNRKQDQLAKISNFDHSYTTWNEILKKHVSWDEQGVSSTIDYNNVDLPKLDYFLAQSQKVSKTEFELWSRDQQLAFYINVYNAQTVKRVILALPNIESIKETGTLFKSPWKYKFFKLFGQKTSLDQIEHEFVRASGNYNNAMVHFGFVCAAKGCPGIRDEAFLADRLSEQLQDSMERFLRDSQRNYANDGQLFLSKIFKWYRQDFEQAAGSEKQLLSFVELHKAHIKGAEDINFSKATIQWTHYDWQLNKLSNPKVSIE